MDVLSNYFYREYQRIMDTADPRFNTYWLADSPITLFTILCLWLYFIKSLGPKLMKNRRPFDLKTVIIIYNAVQIIINLWLFIEFLILVIKLRINLFCQPVDYSTEPILLHFCKICYFYFLLKLVDLVETIFFVLRKKQAQISFLHIYHHVVMVVTIWIGFTWYLGGQNVIVPLLNTFVHAVMYGYYLITAVSGDHKKYIWWKKHITQLQLAQHATIILSFTYAMLNTKCNYPTAMGVLALSQTVIITLLFLNFYIRAYIKKWRKNK